MPTSEYRYSLQCSRTYMNWARNYRNMKGSYIQMEVYFYYLREARRWRRHALKLSKEIG